MVKVSLEKCSKHIKVKHFSRTVLLKVNMKYFESHELLTSTRCQNASGLGSLVRLQGTLESCSLKTSCHQPRWLRHFLLICCIIITWLLSH